MTRDARPAPTSKSDRGSAEKALSRGITVASGQVTHEYSRIVQKHFDSFMTVELGTDVIYRKNSTYKEILINAFQWPQSQNYLENE